MTETKDKLKRIQQLKKEWQEIDKQTALSTREKLEKLVSRNLNKFSSESANKIKISPLPIAKQISDVIVKEFAYPFESCFGSVRLSEWADYSANDLEIISADKQFAKCDPLKLLFFDTETTGLSGGTGTIAFMAGFGYFSAAEFKVKIFILNDISREELFLENIDQFLNSLDISATVTYNGKGFDFPLMETRYILNRKRFPLLKKPHLDYLYSARTIWRNTYESRRLGYLGENLLGIGRDDDIEGSQIPSLYFNYLRSKDFSLIEKIVEHNALDIVGLACLLLLGIKYLNNISHTRHEGEIFGIAVLWEKTGNIKKAEEYYRILIDSAANQDISSKSIKRLSLLKKKENLLQEATQLWDKLSQYKDYQAFKELAIYYEHHSKDYKMALEYTVSAINQLNLTLCQQQELEKRANRLLKKLQLLEKQSDNLT
jgi:uncharacterized protein YprB with RNaseH-like and TPR domain